MYKWAFMDEDTEIWICKQPATPPAPPNFVHVAIA